jgi:hypothetical protein
MKRTEGQLAPSRRERVDLQMNEIPASARVLDCSPAGERRDPTMNMPTQAHERPVRRSLRRPTWSTTAEPGGQPKAQAERGRLTSESTAHGGDGVDQVELTLGVTVGDTSETEKDGKEVWMSAKSTLLERRLTSDETVTSELTPARDHGAEPEAVAVGGGVEDLLEVPELTVTSLERDGGLDLLDLELDDGGFDITGGGVVLGEDVDSAVTVTTSVEPTWRLLDEEDKEAVDDSGTELEVEAGAP